MQSNPEARGVKGRVSFYTATDWVRNMNSRTFNKLAGFTAQAALADLDMSAEHAAAVSGEVILPDNEFLVAFDAASGALTRMEHKPTQWVAQRRPALSVLGIDTREWAALICLDDERGLSQAEVAQRLGIDRTTMVALVDELQAKGLVAREAHPDDRRKNRLGLTPDGRKLLQQGAPLVDDAEHRFLAVLDEPDAQHLKSALRAVIGPNKAVRRDPRLPHL
jgi:DNA-binding MarR family transcriptional regulator